MKRKRRKSRGEIVEELLRTDDTFRRLKEPIEHYRAKADGEECRRESS